MSRGKDVHYCQKLLIFDECNFHQTLHISLHCMHALGSDCLPMRSSVAGGTFMNEYDASFASQLRHSCQRFIAIDYECVCLLNTLKGVFCDIASSFHDSNM